jgi:DMSO/TMAO reductase YedYZ heme-binding membrane subunit
VLLPLSTTGTWAIFVGVVCSVSGVIAIILKSGATIRDFLGIKKDLVDIRKAKREAEKVESYIHTPTDQEVTKYGRKTSQIRRILGVFAFALFLSWLTHFINYSVMDERRPKHPPVTSTPEPSTPLLVILCAAALLVASIGWYLFQKVRSRNKRSN